MMFAQIQQWAALLLIFGAASTTHAKPNRLSHAGSIDEVQQQQQHSQIHKRDASVPMTTIQLQHGEHINSLSTLKQAIEGGRKTQQVKSTNPTKLNSYAQTACYDVAATKYAVLAVLSFEEASSFADCRCAAFKTPTPFL